MEITYYTKQTAPHRCVEEFVSKYHYLDWDACEKHAAHPEDVKAGYGCFCAACNWDTPQLRKLRREKKAKFEASLKRKLQPLKPQALPRYVPLMDEEAARVVLPNFPKPWDGKTLTAEDKALELAAVRYLEAMVGDSEGGNRREWSCGCTADERGNVEPCERHRLALRDFEA